MNNERDFSSIELIAGLEWKKQKSNIDILEGMEVVRISLMKGF